MQADKPQGGAVEGARRQLIELRSFVVAKGIVSVPNEEQPQVVEAPPYNRANFAYINVPARTSSARSTATTSPRRTRRGRPRSAPSTSRARRRLLYTSVHEVWPGHFLQFQHSNRNPSKVAALWVGYAYAEGWAHYCEEMMWEEGLGDGDPEAAHRPDARTRCCATCATCRRWGCTPRA